MSDPLLSVVMPTLNDSPYIERAIRSVQQQTYDNVELIIIDDGSTDGSFERITEVADERTKLIQRTDESGVTSARNEGIARANGKYIAVHDGDDWSSRDRFINQVRYLESNPSVALVGTGAYLVDQTGDILSRRRVLESPSLSELIEHNEFVHGSVMIRRKALEELGGYDEWFAVAEDYDLWLRLADKYEVRNIDEPLYYFRQHDDSLYGSNLEELKLYHLLAVRKVQSGLGDELKGQIDEQGIGTLYDQLTTSERRWFHEELAKENLRYGNLREGRRHASELWSIDRKHPLAYALFLLSYTTPDFTKFAARTYRRLRNRSLARNNT